MWHVTKKKKKITAHQRRTVVSEIIKMTECPSFAEIKNA